MAPPPVLSSDKYIQPIERIPRCSTISTAPPIQQQQQIESRQASEVGSSRSLKTSGQTTVVKVLPEDKIRIEIQTSKPSVSKSTYFLEKKPL